MAGYGIGAIDAVLNDECADPQTERKAWQRTFIEGKIGAEPERINGVTVTPSWRKRIEPASNTRSFRR